ncbi:hypothetical protein IMSAGC011_03576 [Lachnospiraceae bacterium]|nr:hypothetical protein IMSAGC011_03576 [Lachnospiraceae bacterium]
MGKSNLPLRPLTFAIISMTSFFTLTAVFLIFSYCALCTSCLANMSISFACSNSILFLMISRLMLPLSVCMPLRSKALATAPIWIVGSLSIPCSLKERCSQCSAIPNCSLVALIVSAKSFRHILAFSWLFQSVLSAVWHFHCLRLRLSTFCCPVFLSMMGIRSPFSSRSYTFFCFAPHSPFSVRGRRVSITWIWRLRCPLSFSLSWIAQSAHIPLSTKFLCT